MMLLEGGNEWGGGCFARGPPSVKEFGYSACALAYRSDALSTSHQPKNIVRSSESCTQPGAWT